MLGRTSLVRGELKWLVLAPVLFAATLVVGAQLANAGSAVSPSQATSQEARCGECHSAVNQSYQGTAHRHASGPATENFVAGDFYHAPSHARYRVYEESGKVWMSFAKANDPLVRGKRQLLYYIGQGRRGTTYLFSVDGYYFEAPINLYTRQKMW